MDYRLKIEPVGKVWHTIEIIVNGQVIGKYERTNKNNIVRKILEIENSIDLLYEIYKRNGFFEVVWEEGKSKEIRVDDKKISVIPEETWRPIEKELKNFYKHLTTNGIKSF